MSLSWDLIWGGETIVIQICLVTCDIILTELLELLQKKEMQSFHKGQSHSLHKELLNGLLGKMLTIHGVWSSRLPDVNPCNYYLWGAFKEEFMTKIHIHCKQ